MEELKKCPFCGAEADVKMEHKHCIGYGICQAIGMALTKLKMIEDGELEIKHK